MMRILLFLATNLAVLVIASITLKLLGVDRFTGQNYGSLLVFCALTFKPRTVVKIARPLRLQAHG